MSDLKEASPLDKYSAKLTEAADTGSLGGISAISTLALKELTLHSKHSATMLQDVSSTLKGVGPGGTSRPMTMQTVLAPASIAGLHDVLMVSVQPQIAKLDTGLQELKQNSSNAWQALDRKIVALEITQKNFDRDIHTYVDKVKAELLTIIECKCNERCDKLSRDIHTYVDTVKTELVTLIESKCTEHCDKMRCDVQQDLGNACQTLDRKILVLEIGQKNFDRDIRTYVDAVKTELVTIIGRECRERCDKLHDNFTKLESYAQERDSTHASRIDEFRRELGDRIDRELNDQARQLDRDRALYVLTDELGNLVRQLAQGATGAAGGGGATGGGGTSGRGQQRRSPSKP